MTITLNKSNWTGETASIRINQTSRAWKQDGETYRLAPDGDDAFVIQQQESTGWRQVGRVFRLTGDPVVWFASSDFSDLSREADCPFKAAIKLNFSC